MRLVLAFREQRCGVPAPLAQMEEGKRLALSARESVGNPDAHGGSGQRSSNIHYFLVLVPQNLSQVIYQHCDIIY